MRRYGKRWPRHCRLTSGLLIPKARPRNQPCPDPPVASERIHRDLSFSISASSSRTRLCSSGVRFSAAAFLSHCLCSTHGEPERSEEHTSELQSHLNLVCRLLLEKKKK